MGVTIEIYHSRIGSHHNFIQSCVTLSQLKGKFLNQLLIMFYLKVFYLSYLKFLVTKTKNNNELCAWYTQMIWYHVYVPLLLRLSNDVEENPGPRDINEIVNPTYTVHADFHQGFESRFGSNAGKQCVAMSLCSTVYNEIISVNIWETAIMNQILFYGNNLYSLLSQSINKDFLLLTEVPEFVAIDNDTFHLAYSVSFSGALFMTINNYPYVTLEHACNEIFFNLHYKSCLLTIGMNTVAIFMPFPDVFKIFDSHSRDLHGMPCASGDCVLTTVEGIQNLISYFHITSCCYQNVCQPFELKGVRCNRIDSLNMNLPLSANLSMQNAFSETLVNESELESNSNKRECIIKDKNSGSVQTQSTLPHEEESMLARARDLKRAKRKNESPGQKEMRLAKQKSYRKIESVDAREKRLAGQRLKRKNEPLEARENRLATRRIGKMSLKRQERRG